MRRLTLVLGLLWALPALSQTTTVSGTITDSGGQVWFNGSIQFLFRPADSNPTGQYFQGGVPFDKSTTVPTAPQALDATGSFSGLAVPDNATISPSHSTFDVKVCPAASTSCLIKSLTITGATLNISALIIPPPVHLDLSVPLAGSRAYTDSEVFGALPGTQYFNVTDNRMHVCLQTGFPPCTWAVQTASTDLVNTTPVTVHANTTNAQNLQSAILAAGGLNALGKTFRFHSAGQYQIAAGGVGTTTANIIFTVGGVSFTLGTGSGTSFLGTQNGPYFWTIDGYCTTTTVGASGRIVCGGSVQYGVSVSGQDSSTFPFFFIPLSPIDLTIAETLQMQVIFSAASTSNTATGDQLITEQFN